MKTKRTVLLAGLIFALLAVALILPSMAQAGKAKNTIIVGTTNDFPPFESGQGNRLQGFDIDLVQEIAARLEYEVQFKVREFDSLIPGLVAKNPKFDMVAAAMSIVDFREEIIDFSDPYVYDPVNGGEAPYYGFGFPTDSPLRDQVNEVLHDIGDDGTYRTLYLKWFGEEPTFIP